MRANALYCKLVRTRVDRLKQGLQVHNPTEEKLDPVVFGLSLFKIHLRRDPRTHGIYQNLEAATDQGSAFTLEVNVSTSCGVRSLCLKVNARYQL